MPPPSAGRSANARAHLFETLRPVVEKAGYELEDVTVTAAGRRSLVRVSVDTAEPGGIDLDGVAEVSRAVSEVLDAPGRGSELTESVLPGPYVLEVSSPGVDRPLTEPRHWRRASGRLVQVPVGERTVTGRVVEVSDTGVGLEVDGVRRDYPWAELGRGKVQVEFNRATAQDEGELEP